MIKKISLAAVGMTAAFSSFADSEHSKAIGGASGHAPIGVMGDHMHKEGEFMLSLRYMDMRMDDLRHGNDDINTKQLIENSDYDGAPTSMTMEGFMLGAMYSPSDSVTLMAMIPYRKKSMNMIHAMNMDMDMPKAMPMSMPMEHYMTMNMQSSGWGDTTVSALISGWQKDQNSVHWTLGVSIPTGSIDKDDSNGILPYGMQMGSGTWDAKLGLTYNSKDNHRLSWGSQVLATVRTGDNDRDYRLGNEYEFSMWGAYSLNRAVSLSARIKASSSQDIRGSDDDLSNNNAHMRNKMTTSDPENYGGKRVDVLLGVNTLVTGGVLKGNRFAVEYALPVMQDLNGIQLETTSTLIVGWQLAFH